MATTYYFLIPLSLLMTPSLSYGVPNLIDSIHVEKNIVRVKADKSFHHPYLVHDFFAEYDADFNLEALPLSVVTIPFILNVAPIVWISNKTYGIEEMDEDLYHALSVLQKIFQAFYQSKTWSGTIVPKKLVKNTKPHHPNTVATLFSHGLDAVYTALTNNDKKQLLITVCGSDIGLKQDTMWRNVQDQCRSFARSHGQQNAFVRSNFNTFRNFNYLRDLTPEINRNWFGWTSQSFSYTSLAAPLAYANGCSHVLLASTRTSENPVPYGTHPVIDNAIAFAGMRVEHDGPHVNRLEKIRVISHLCAERSYKKPLLRVCWGKDPLGGNCNECEKCFRTIVELLVEGENPHDYGFILSLEDAIKSARAKAPGKKLDTGLYWHWKCIQTAARQSELNNKKVISHPQLLEFVQWIATMDLEQHRKMTKNIRSEAEKTKFAQLWHKAADHTFTVHDLAILYSDVRPAPQSISQTSSSAK